MAKKDLFGREKDAERRAALEREAAEEVERLTRRTMASPGGILGGGGSGGIGGGPVAPPSDLEMIAESVRERPRGRGATGLGGRAPNPASAFPYGAAMLSGAVGSGLGPAGLSPGPGNRGSGSAVPQGQKSTPSPDYDEPISGRFGRVDDDEEEMSITEMALADYAARSGSSLEDVAMQVDVESAEETRDRAMQRFHERQQNVRRPMSVVTDPFAPAAMRSKSATAAAAAQAKLDAPGGRQRPESAGSALAARIAARRRQDQERSGGGPLGGARLAPVEEPVPLGKLHTQARARTRAAVVTEPAPAVEPESSGPEPSDPNAHLYEALMEERAARLALEARLEALAAGAAAGAAPTRAPRKPAASRKAAPVKKAPAKRPGAAKGDAAAKKVAGRTKPVVAKKVPAAVKKAVAKKVAAKSATIRKAR